MVLSALPICRREAQRSRHTPLDQEDLVGRSQLALVRASKRFDPKRGVPFTAYARMAIKSAVFDVIRRHAREESLGDGTFASALSLETLGRNNDDDLVWEPKDPRVLEDLVEHRAILRILFGMPFRERHALLRSRVDGASAAEIGAELGVSVDVVYRLTQDGGYRLRLRREKLLG